MVFEQGMFVSNPKKPEWGTGLILDVDGAVLKIVFQNDEKNRIRRIDPSYVNLKASKKKFSLTAEDSTLWVITVYYCDFPEPLNSQLLDGEKKAAKLIDSNSTVVWPLTPPNGKKVLVRDAFPGDLAILIACTGNYDETVETVKGPHRILLTEDLGGETIIYVQGEGEYDEVSWEQFQDYLEDVGVRREIKPKSTVKIGKKDKAGLLDIWKKI